MEIKELWRSPLPQLQEAPVPELVFSEFETSEPVAKMREADRNRCEKPRIYYSDSQTDVTSAIVQLANDFRSRNYARIGIILFDLKLVSQLLKEVGKFNGPVHQVRERGEALAAVPRSGTYVMTPETCGGLEFDAVILAGVDEGRVPPPIGNLGPQGYLMMEEDATKELYTAITRARYQLVFVSDSSVGISPMLKASINSALLDEINWCDYKTK